MALDLHVKKCAKNYPAAYLSHFNDIILSVFDDIGASSTLSSLTTWLRRPLRNDQLGGTKRRYSVAEPNDAKQGKSRMIWAPCIVQFELRLAQFSPACFLLSGPCGSLKIIACIESLLVALVVMFA